MTQPTSGTSRPAYLAAAALLAAVAWVLPGSAQDTPADEPSAQPEDNYEEQPSDGEHPADGEQPAGGEQGAGGGGGGDDTNGGEGVAAAGQNDNAAAESLRRVGRGLMELGQYDEACPKLAQSWEAKANGDTALLLATCSEHQGRIASAWASYRQAAFLLQAAGDTRFTEANDRAIELEPKVPKLIIVPAARVPGMEVWRGETRFSAGIFGVPVAVDPGPQRIEIRAEGYKTWSTQVNLKASERVTVAIPALVKDSPPPPVVVLRSHRGTLFTAGVITAGFGVASIAVGALLGAAASREVHNAETDDSLCGLDKKCTPAGMDAIESADAKAVASTVMFSIGGAAIIGGFVMVLLDKGSIEEADSVASVLPLIGPTGGGLSVTVRF